MQESPAATTRLSDTQFGYGPPPTPIQLHPSLDEVTVSTPALSVTSDPVLFVSTIGVDAL